MVMAQSLFKVLKMQMPESALDVLAPEWSHPLLKRMPEVRQAIALPIGHGVFGLQVRIRIAQQLKLEQYHQAFVLPNSWKSALIPFLSRIPHRIGWRGEMRYGLLNDLRILDPQKYPRMIDRFVALADSVGIEPPFPRLSAQNLPIQNETIPILALCPGAEFGSSKRWPTTHYARVAEQKLKEGWQVWLFGSVKDRPVSAEINTQVQGRCIDYTGQTTLGEAIDLLAQVTQVVANDSGLMHIAAALSKPLVAIYGSTDPGFTPPLGQDVRIVQEKVPCGPCFKRECPLQHHRCMQTLDPDRVLDALRSMII
jgi:heptosyltransferase-2